MTSGDYDTAFELVETLTEQIDSLVRNALECASPEIKDFVTAKLSDEYRFWK